MQYQIGDKVIHWNFGLGDIVKLDDKIINSHETSCYVVKIRDLTIWVPTDESGASVLRFPTPGSEYKNIFSIFHAPGEPLSDNRLERKNQLAVKMKDGKLSSLCHVIRDLSVFRRTKKMNDNDTLVLKRAESFLLAEWMFSLSVSFAQAQGELVNLLGVQQV